MRKLFKYAQEKNFAIPAINVTSSITVVASLEAARDAKSPIIIQMSQGGAVSQQSARCYLPVLTVFVACRPISPAKVRSATQISNGFADAGVGVSNSNQEASIAGAIAGAHYIRSIAPIYGIPVVLHTVGSGASAVQE